MKCPKCHFDTPEGLKFCGECGSRIENLCPQCKFSNPLQFKFCGECGCNLSATAKSISGDLSSDEKISKIQKYLPQGIIEKILSQRDRVEGERKKVTVMFCDMEGFTSLSEKIEPEEVYAIMDQVYEILIHSVHKYDGTVNEMTGDGIMALFGAPIALEDAPQRAIRSAYSIHRDMLRFSDRIRPKTQAIAPLKMRIGIHTGSVVVGTLGNDLRVEFKAVGDTVNLASRMQELAEPGSTYVSEETFNLTEGLFRFEAIGEKKVRGKQKSVKMYRVIAPSARRTRFDVAAERGLTPFVGRKRELEVLLNGFERAKGINGQAISIIAEAGAGKSRLLYEFRKAVVNEDVTFLEGKCLSYSRGVPYHAIIDILKSTFDIQEKDGDFEIRTKVENGLKILEMDETFTLPYLLELLAIKDSGIDRIPMSPEARRDHIMQALKWIVIKGAEVRPLVIAFEDLHWVDGSTKDFLGEFLNSISETRIFLILTYRPEFVPPWGNKSYHSHVNLNRLSHPEIMAVVSFLFGNKAIEVDLKQLILEKTEGVPFFIEEFVKSLKDLKVIEEKEDECNLSKNIGALTIPSTIQDVIMARVDTLSEDAKKVLQTGSVIEREFSYELIKQVTGFSEHKLMTDLSALMESELIFEKGSFPQSNYIFKHALTREVVNESILSKRKKQLHGKIGDVIEQLYKNSLDEYYGLLADHYIAGQNYQKGAFYSKLAERKAEKTASLNDAITFSAKRISSLEMLPQTDGVHNEIIEARTVLGLYFSQINYWVKAKIAVDPIIEPARAGRYEKWLSKIYTIIGTYNFMVEEDFSNAFENLEESLRISEKTGDNATLLFANFWLGSALALDCRFEEALRKFEKAININLAANNLWGTAMMKSVVSVFVHYLRGRMTEAHRTSYNAVQIAEQSGDIVSKSWAYTCHGICCYGKGILEEAVEHLLIGADFCEKINLFHCNALAQSCLGEIHFEVGKFQISKKHHEKAIWLLEHNKSSATWLNFNKIAFVAAKVMNHEKDIDLESLYFDAHKNKVKMFEGLMRRYVAEILLNFDDRHIDEAQDWILKAIEADRRNGTIFHLSKDYTLNARLLKRKGDKPKAKENIMKAIEIYEKCDASAWAKRACGELKSLS